MFFFCNNFFLFHSFTQQLIRCCRLATSWSMASVRNSYIWIDGKKHLNQKEKKTTKSGFVIDDENDFLFFWPFRIINTIVFSCCRSYHSNYLCGKNTKNVECKMGNPRKKSPTTIHFACIYYILFLFCFFCVKIDKW